MKNFRFYGISFLLVVSVLLISCNNEKTDKMMTEQKVEKKLSVYCDEAVYKLMERPVFMFDSIFTKYEIDFIRTSAWDAMAKLLATQTDAIVLEREYNEKEDSLMKVYGVKPHLRMTVANDALVFYTKFDFTLDTLNVNIIRDVLLNNENIRQYFKKLPEEPTFVTNDNLSSEVFHLKTMVAENKKIVRKIKQLSGSDSVINFVKNTPNTIGIGFFSQVVKEPELKKLMIGFTDSTGAYINPRIVHQANIVQKFYPFITSIYVYVLNDKDEPTLAFERFLARNGLSQRYFLNYGIVPAYAKIKLIDER